ncbi:MAG: tetratricopeptide repeat protein [Roseinatronobacter sp.]|jgi:Tfp pilus assembly protein PilF|nr:tetratricopeptide repeat protein [Roseinatronobacter sp.]
MRVHRAFLNPLIAALAVFFAYVPANAQENRAEDEVAQLLGELRAPDQQGWQRIERQIQRLWSRSGSASADLLLQRGRDAIRRGDTTRAVEHFSAVIDHAPDFAEAYHARAMAWFMAGRLGLALDDLQHALSLNPQHFTALIGLGRIFEELNAHERARKAYDAAHAIHPHRDDVKAARERLERRLSGTEI